MTAAGTTKRPRVDTIMTVIDARSVIVGCMSWETPSLKLQDQEGNIYRWISDKLPELGLWNMQPGEQLRIKASVRPGQFGRHLFRVTAEKVERSS